jgi:lysophospholipase L1-like esterase
LLIFSILRSAFNLKQADGYQSKKLLYYLHKSEIVKHIPYFSKQSKSRFLILRFKVLTLIINALNYQSIFVQKLIYKTSIMAKSILFRNYPWLFSLTITFLLLSSCGLLATSNQEAEKIWVGTWGTAPQLVEPHNMPPEPGLTNNSLRQVVRVSIGGDTLRFKFSNEFSTSPVTMKSVQIAVSTGGHTIDGSTNKELKFNGIPEVTMNEGEAVLSDPVAFELEPRMDVAITVYYGQTSETVTGHPGSRTTSFILPGNLPSNTDFSESVKTDRWYNINRIDVLAPPPAATIAILGNSITDGRGSITNEQNRWPDILSEQLLKNPETQHIGVLNMGIGGNAVLRGGLGPTGISRFERDILDQPGVKWAIIYHGVNDIGGVRTAEAAKTRANGLIDAYRQMIEKAKQRDIRIFGATIMPFKGNGYYNEHSERCRQLVNDWIRNSGIFDAVIDFDKVLQSPDDPTRIISSYQNDGLHPDATGYKKMGESVDLRIFTGASSEP